MTGSSLVTSVSVCHLQGKELAGATAANELGDALVPVDLDGASETTLSCELQ